MDIFGIFKRAWDITWKYKGLWVLGILAGCSTGGGGGGSGNASRATEFRMRGDELPQIQRWVESVPEETWTTIGIAVIIGGLLLVLITWVLATLGTGGLIAGFRMADEGEAVTLGRAFQDGAKHFWKLLLIQLIPGLLALLLIVPFIISFATVGALTAGIGLVCLVPLLCLLVPLSILIGIYIQLTQVALVNDHLTVRESFRAAWDVTRNQPGNILIMALVLGVGNFIASLVLSIPFFLLAIPFLVSLMGEGTAAAMSNISTLLIGGLIYLPFLLVANGILRTFITGSWTLTYRDMIHPDMVDA